MKGTQSSTVRTRQGERLAKNEEGAMQIGDVAIVKECHKIPELVGKEVKVIALVDPTMARYPVSVMLVDAPSEGIYGFREDELEPKADIPDVFKDAFPQ